MQPDTIRYKRSFAERHRIYGVSQHDETYLMFKFYVEEKFYKFDEHEFDDILKVEEEDKPFNYEKKIVLFGWCPFKLFYGERLRVGRWKIPLFKTPMPKAVKMSELKAYSYLKYGTLFIRVSLPGEKEPVSILPAETAIRGYQTPGYLQQHLLEPEDDEYASKN